MERRDGRVIEVTPASLRAGAAALQEWRNSEDYYDAGALHVLRAMLADSGIVIVTELLKLDPDSAHLA